MTFDINNYKIFYENFCGHEDVETKMKGGAGSSLQVDSCNSEKLRNVCGMVVA